MGGGKFRDLSGFSADFNWTQKVHCSSHKHDLHIFRVCFDWNNKLGGLWKAFGEFRMHFGYDKLAYVGHLLPQGKRIQISRIFPFLSSLSQRHQKNSSDRFQSPQKASLSIVWVTEIIVDTLKVWIGSVEVNADPRLRVYRGVRKRIQRRIP